MFEATLTILRLPNEVTLRAVPVVHCGRNLYFQIFSIFGFLLLTPHSGPSLIIPFKSAISP